MAHMEYVESLKFELRSSASQSLLSLVSTQIRSQFMGKVRSWLELEKFQADLCKWVGGRQEGNNMSRCREVDWPAGSSKNWTFWTWTRIGQIGKRQVLMAMKTRQKNLIHWDRRARQPFPLEEALISDTQNFSRKVCFSLTDQFSEYVSDISVPSHNSH